MSRDECLGEPSSCPPISAGERFAADTQDRSFQAVPNQQQACCLPRRQDTLDRRLDQVLGMGQLPELGEADGGLAVSKASWKRVGRIYRLGRTGRVCRMVVLLDEYKGEQTAVQVPGAALSRV